LRFHALLIQAIEHAERKPPGPPSLEDHTAFMTDVGLAVGVTLPNGELLIDDFEATWTSYCRDYEPLPFVFQDLPPPAA
jgi:hypothetical protein